MQGPAFKPPPPARLSNDELLRRAGRRTALARGEFEGGGKTPSQQDIADASDATVAEWLHAGLLVQHGMSPKGRRGRAA